MRDTPKYACCYAIGFSLWKRPFCQPYLLTLAKRVKWVNKLPQTLPADTCVVSWGVRVVKTVNPCFYMEDAFFHSDGLGSDLVPPRSLVIDDAGLYFDARKPSQLIHILNAINLDALQQQRAQALIQSILVAGLSKYNLGRAPVMWQRPQHKQVILVPGQVADDASVILGVKEPMNMQRLLQVVREANPDAYIVYKPHPDVLTGNRQGLIDAQASCDCVDVQADIVSLIEICDEVHTLTSLVGFDALLRGKKVVTYGMPFYAGWGLTYDRAHSIRFRTRVLDLPALVYGVLVEYPIYWDWHGNRPSSPEQTLQALALTADRNRKTPLPRLVRLIRNGSRWCKNVISYYLDASI